MPLHFASKRDYISKLIELLLKQAQLVKEKVEMIATSNIQWQYDTY